MTFLINSIVKFDETNISNFLIIRYHYLLNVYSWQNNGVKVFEVCNPWQ